MKQGLTLVLLLTLFGCSSGGNTPTRYFLVDAVEQPALGSYPDMSIQLIDLQIPQYLERYQIATRLGRNQLFFSETNQWGENLRKNLIRTMGTCLAGLLGTVDISTPLNRTGSPADYRLRIYISQFDRDADGRVQLTARWQVSAASGEEPLSTRARIYVSEDRYVAGDYEGIVDAMATLFGELSGDIAATLIELESAT